MRLGALIALVCAGLWANACRADTVEAIPGSGTITAAAAKAKEGDTIKLGAGDYIDSVDLPAGVTLEGAGDKSTLTATGYSAVNCKGPGVTVIGVTIKPAEKTIRGVNTSNPLRVERCRFVGVKEAVAMMGAPLSDVVGCEFIDCGIGVRAIGGACPTVYACFFTGGGTGVFAMDGMPYIRNNLFQKQRTGIRMIPGAEQPIVRNNLFVDCTDAGIELLPKESAIQGPSIRNNIFERCGTAVTGNATLLSKTSHCLVHAAGAPAFRDKDGAELLKLGERGLAEGDAGVEVSPSGVITLAHADLVDGKGVHAGGDAEGQAPRIGPEAAWMRSGCAATGELPPVRFKPPTLIANAVAEEYQYLRTRGLGMDGQATGREGGHHLDVMSCTDGGKPVTLKFDIDRYWDEMSVKP